MSDWTVHDSFDPRCAQVALAQLQGEGVRIWVWPRITDRGSQLLQWNPVVYEFGLKSNMSTTSKDNFHPGQVSSCTTEPSNNTSLKSTLREQNKTADVIYRENVSRWYLTFEPYWTTMWNILYFISHIHRKGRIGYSHFPGYHWPQELECLTTANS